MRTRTAVILTAVLSALGSTLVVMILSMSGVLSIGSPDSPSPTPPQISPEDVERMERARDQARLYCTMAGVAPYDAGPDYLSTDEYRKCVRIETNNIYNGW